VQRLSRQNLVRQIAQEGFSNGSANGPARLFLAVFKPRRTKALRQLPLGVKLVDLDSVSDDRGALIAAEWDRHIPFEVRRCFVVFDVPSSELRGAHAHRNCHQFLIALGGSVSVQVSDGHRVSDLTLERANIGLYMPPMTWGTQTNYSPTTALLVLASHEYDSSDYIREYAEFVRLSQRLDV